MEETGNTIVEAKNLYMQQLCELLSPLLYQGIKSIFDTCKENNNKKVLKTFQEKLCSVIKWNQTIIDKEYSRIVSDSDCTWLSKLIEAVFISHVKVLSSVTMKSNSSINLKIPDTKNFIHKCYIECARYFYVDPSLIDDREMYLNYVEIQRNIKRSNLAISNSIEKTIRDLIPIQEILESYLNQIEEPSTFVPLVDTGNQEHFGDIENNDDNDDGDSNSNDNDDSNVADSSSIRENNDDNNSDNAIENKLFMEDPDNSSGTNNNRPNLDIVDGDNITDVRHQTTGYNSDGSDEVKNIVIPSKTHAENNDSPFFSDSE